jgi:hypothetical protein
MSPLLLDVLRMTEIRGLRKDFSQQPNESIVTWLLQCCDNGANSVLLDRREAHQLGSIARDLAVGRGISGCQDEALPL